jgi:SET domain-containing protein
LAGRIHNAGIDGAAGGNETRHLNHACAPNCEAVEYHDTSVGLGLRIETIRAVRLGEELTLDYALQVDPSSQDEHACACGAASYRGTMLEQSAGT